MVEAGPGLDAHIVRLPSAALHIMPSATCIVSSDPAMRALLRDVLVQQLQAL